MVNRETNRTNCTRVTAVPNGLTNCMGAERGGPSVQRTSRNETTPDLTGPRVRGVRNYCSELSIEGGGYCKIVRKRFVIKRYGLVGGYGWTFAGKGTKEGPEMFGVVFV